MAPARSFCTLALLMLFFKSPAHADSTDAACVIYPKGSDQATATIPRRFYQAQGRVVITRSDGVEHDLAPNDSTPGNFTDQQGNVVYRQGDLGDQGLIFRLPDESVYVYWNTSMLEPVDESNPTWPFTTADYDATALFRCKAPGDAEFATCPGGILRMEDGQASIVVQNQAGEQFTLNFMTDYVNASNRPVTARLDGDLWTLEFENGEVWEVPLAAIEGD
jgi:hypothetical protein